MNNMRPMNMHLIYVGSKNSVLFRTTRKLFTLAPIICLKNLYHAFIVFKPGWVSRENPSYERNDTFEYNICIEVIAE